MLASHDRKVLPVLFVAGALLFFSTQPIIDYFNQSSFFSGALSINTFVARMASQSHPHDYALFCYGLSFFITPYFFYILMRSERIKEGIEVRYKKGGRAALLVSAIGALGIFIGIFFYFQDFTPEHISRINYLMFYSRVGITIFSLGFTYFLVLMWVSFFLYFREFFKRS